MKKVSICIPNHNRAEYLAEAINSALNQTYKNIEVIVVDDASTDSSVELLEWYGDRIKVFVNDKNEGISFTRNKAVQEATGDYIAVMDSDDIMAPNRIELSMKAIKDKDFVYSHYMQANDAGRVFGAIEAPQKLDIPNVIEGFTAPHVTIVAKKKCFEEHPYLNKYTVNDDLELVCSWLKAGYTYKLINEPLMIVRYHDTSVSKTQDEKVKKFTEEIKRDYGIE